MMKMDSNSQPGIKCPACEFFIHFSIPDLLSKDEFVCPGCGLHLRMDRGASRRSMEALSELNAAMDNANAVKQKYEKK